MMKISLIVPCYNEENSLLPFYNELNNVSKDMSDYDFEMIFIDDGSSDKTLSILKDIAKDDSRVTYISFSKNFGKEAAMYAGFCNCTGDYAAVMDADMQDPPSLLPQMVDILKSGEYDSVATRRVSRKGEPRIRSFFANTFYKIMKKCSKVEIVSGARDFRLMRREMVDAIVSMCEENRFSKGIFGWIGFKTYWLPFENVERVAGKSKWSFGKLFSYSLNGIFSFSSSPLKIPVYLGIILSLISFVPFGFMLYNAINYGFSMAINGVSDNLILFTLLLVGGLILLSIGIIGQYISRTYDEVKGRPHYIIAQTNKENVVKR
ncbi:MAG: glycosyltransferase family 2 protein [Clostridia bacterium]|nr:glycosyltransferase family 2 protein [Clostridia bacterium]